MPIALSCSSIGALVLTKGGLSIDCTENASSSSVGGAITVVGGVATNTADINTKIVGVDSKLATLNTAVSTTNTKVDASNRSLASLSDSVTPVGTESFVKTSVNQVVPPTKLFVQSMTISGTGKPLRKQTLQNGITVKASPDNVSTVFIGGTSIQNNTMVFKWFFFSIIHKGRANKSTFITFQFWEIRI